MALFGAYDPEKIYSIEDIRDLVKYALSRGVKIIPELDSPAHAGMLEEAIAIGYHGVRVADHFSVF